MSDLHTKYKMKQRVRYIKTKEEGKIASIPTKNGSPLYLVLFPGDKGMSIHANDIEPVEDK